MDDMAEDIGSDENIDSESPTEILVRCISCGIITERSKVEERCWYKICDDKEMYVCCNCDVTIVDK